MHKKRIGILTFHRFVNYGGLLQAYALVTILTKLGAQPELIDYRCERLENVGNAKLFCKGISLKRRIKKIWNYPFNRYKDELFNSFVQQYLPVSIRQYYNKIELKEASNEYEAIITGSDQVWHPVWPMDESYFLTFVNQNIAKYSYAASFGDKEIKDNQKDFYRKALSKFTKISVREEEDIRTVKDITGRTAMCCLDPVLLLNIEDWSRFTNEIKSNYVLIYTVNEPQNLIKEAKRYALKQGLDLIYLNPSFFQSLNPFSCKKIRDASPQMFLSLFANASCVFTNSFHGTVFSIIFQKKFWVESGNKKMRNKRIDNILNVLHLEQRKFPSNGIEEIDWQQVMKSLEQERQNSLQYLKEIVDI